MEPQVLKTSWNHHYFLHGISGGGEIITLLGKKGICDVSVTMNDPKENCVCRKPYHTQSFLLF